MKTRTVRLVQGGRRGPLRHADATTTLPGSSPPLHAGSGTCRLAWNARPRPRGPASVPTPLPRALGPPLSPPPPILASASRQGRWTAHRALWRPRSPSVGDSSVPHGGCPAHFLSRLDQAPGGPESRAGRCSGCAREGAGVGTFNSADRVKQTSRPRGGGPRPISRRRRVRTEPMDSEAKSWSRRTDFRVRSGLRRKRRKRKQYRCWTRNQNMKKRLAFSTRGVA